MGAAYFQTFDYEKASLEFAAAAELVPGNVDFAANLKKAKAVAAGEEAHDAPMKSEEEPIVMQKESEATA